MNIAKNVSGVLMLPLLASVSGCMTGEMLKSSGKLYEDGHYVTGTTMGLMAVVVGPIIDVVTLGGTLNSPEKATSAYSYALPVAVAAANSSGTSSQPTTATYQTSPAPSYTSQATANTQSHTFEPSTQRGEQDHVQAKQDPFVYAESVNSCLVVEKNPAGPTRRRVRNACTFTIDVTYCDITDAGNECQRRLWKRVILRSGATDFLFATNKEMKYVACREPFSAGGTMRYASGQVSGTCRDVR
ncbi:hypothetical protein [Pseudomonas putida]|uniref:hypothetical protein n=1 Tax=Pseudomonas TaxID=286 RepID=UPI0034672853